LDVDRRQNPLAGNEDRLLGQKESPMHQLPVVDLAVLILYAATVVAFGCYFVRKSRSTHEFMAAGGSLPGWAVGLSIFGTYLSSNTFLGVPGKAYGTNWNAFVFSLALPPAAWIAVRYFVPFYRQTGEISAYHHLEHRFGPWARSYAVICYLLTQVARMGSIMFGVALAMRALTGWDMATIIVATGAGVTLYTLMGGIEAVIWTDVVQSIVLMVGALLIAGLLMFDYPGGPIGAIHVAHAHGKFGLGSIVVDGSWWPDLDLTRSTFWVVLLYGFFINLNNFGIDQNFVQRYHAAKSDQEAVRSVWLGAWLYVPISLLFFFIGSMLFAYYDANPRMLDEVARQVAEERLRLAGDPINDASITATAAKLGPSDVGDKVLPHFMTEKLPPGVAGLIIAAIFAAAMSSVDTSLNSSATVILSDVYRRYVNPDIGEKGAMRVLHLATLIWGAIGTSVALALIGAESLLDAWWLLSGIFAGGMLGLFLLGLICRRAGNAAAVTGVTIGVLVIIWMTIPGYLPEAFRSPLHSNMIIVVGTLTIFLVGLAVSRFAGRGDVRGDEAV